MTRRGSWMSARARATRCCWPPESFEGKAWILCDRPSRERSSSPIERFFPRDSGDEQRHRHVLRSGEGRQEVVLLEEEADVLAPEEDLLGWGEVVDLNAQHRQIPVRPIQESSDDRDERRLAAPARTDQEAQLAEARVKLDAAERLDARVALAEMLPHRAAGNRQAHRKTSAGSSTSTRRMLRMLAIATTNRMHAPVRPAHCHKRTIPRVASLCRKISKNVAAIPVPRPKPSAATLTACSRIIPTSRGLVTPMAFSAPNCFRFSTVNR